jgi:hypothetical protein
MIILKIKGKLTATILSALLAFNVFAVEPAAFEPSVGQLHAYKAYHHAEYLKATAKQAGGTNT